MPKRAYFVASADGERRISIGALLTTAIPPSTIPAASTILGPKGSLAINVPSTTAMIGLI